jgi:small subunit ribosomal protein S4
LQEEHVRLANLLALLEGQLDNVVFRLGLALTVPSARQLVSHGHITVNGRCATEPGFEVKTGDDVAVRQRSRKMPVVAEVADDPRSRSRVICAPRRIATAARP